MLDIVKLSSQLAGLGAYQLVRSDELKKALKQALSEVTEAGLDDAGFQRKLANSSTSWLVAIPTAESPFSTHRAPSALESYTALSTDGSQISPDRHSSHSAYLINIGAVRIGYGEHHGYALASEPTVFFKNEDTLRRYGGEMRPVAGGVLAALRQQMESDALASLVQSYDRHPAIAMVDGTLILWMIEQEAERLLRLEPEDLKRQTFSSFMNMFSVCSRAGVPLAGYISSPGSSDVVNSLKVHVCPSEPVDCDKCAFRNDQTLPCSVIDGITDATLFKNILSPGERSSLFESSSRILKAYGDETVLFFYLHTGKEIARVEIPASVARDRSQLELVHAACLDQADKGMGYPIAIAEAHEQAVVKSTDKTVFDQLITTALIQQGTPIVESRKSLQKRGSFI